MTSTSSKLKPDWAGDDLLSRFVNLLIQTKPLYQVMKYQARQVLIKTAEKNGVAWRQYCEDFEHSEVKTLLPQLENPNVTYPDYYQVPFHAYDSGNLSWQAAFEAIPATYAMGLRVWKEEPISWETAHQRLRNSFLEVLASYSPNKVTDILDIGCSVGISTLALHRYYQQKQTEPIKTVGLDLSPYMLSVAKISDTEGEISEWVHGLAEETPFADNSFDVVTLQLTLHELPRQATQAIFREALRILRPGGAIGIVDNNPLSPVIQGLPPALFVLMKSTEPWSDDYYTFDVENCLTSVGFTHETTVPSDPRHRTIVARKPLN
jgi:ubiquinone/menaquinone biosynthesis C-methylase UbiE